MDYKEHSKNNVDLLLESLLNDNGSGNDMDPAVFMGSTDNLDEFRMAQDIHKDHDNVSPVAEDPITFNMNETVPLQFSLVSSDTHALSILSSSSFSSSSPPMENNKLPSVVSPMVTMRKSHPKSAIIETNYNDTNTALQEKSDMLESGGPFVCHYCDASFRMRGYLTRHIKKHAIEKAYKCPFFSKDAPPELRCHNSGGFSRRDTYKTHLKARHLLYPKGVKPQDRNKSSGHCAQCGEFYQNIENWVEQHIESGDCTGLPRNYVRTVKSERKSGKLKMIKTSSGHSRFISTAKSIIEPKILLNQDALETIAIIATDSTSEEETPTNTFLEVQPEKTKMYKISKHSNNINKKKAVIPVSTATATATYPPLDIEQAPTDDKSVEEKHSKGNIHTDDLEDIIDDFDQEQLYERDYHSTRKYMKLYFSTYRSGI
ncbi:similar to Saccharomyces cerevisiae YHR006W STP2 Transcription factor, activated by proteolytic processing in response to signals from the SPS sensor system for external amino acids [Maudiozyma saulgeensis]|uniref:Transcription factor STP1 n=1 Tax=Maudiozyma saulgeensis TaxID=1789683 RepID=A0A1X7R989_9SACH|nr:similar to Saccharomyces cerevisiae YHR006W STP2 Transcription factor, activated by proteolytic processing in response to signals from the SPS sensor system for external amino acids [Kazachstania saulgeensis]